jgi:hypothetical protein
VYTDEGGSDLNDFSKLKAVATTSMGMQTLQEIILAAGDKWRVEGVRIDSRGKGAHFEGHGEQRK